MKKKGMNQMKNGNLYGSHLFCTFIITGEC